MARINSGVVYLMYGPPASGKTTLASFLSAKLGARYVSLGEIVRREIYRGTDFSLKFKKCLDDVQEYPPELVQEVFNEELDSYEDEKSIFIFDGWPKYPREAPSFLNLIKERGLKLKDILIIDLPLETAIERVEKRKICSGCLKQQSAVTSSVACNACGKKLILRKDDTNFFFKRRYNDYKTSVNEVLKEIGSLAESLIYINGNQSEESIKKDIEDKIKLNMPE